MTEVLISPDYGAGWSTWADNKNKEIAEYKPIIEFIKAGNRFTSDKHPLIDQMVKELDLKYFYAGGYEFLEVVEVNGPYRIEEYDGSESIRTMEDFW